MGNIGDLVKPVDRAVELVIRLIGPSVDAVGNTLGDLVGLAFADRIHAFREQNNKNFKSVIDKAQRKIEEAHINVQPVPIKILEPIFLNAAREDDDYLQERWAALLANAASPENSSQVLPSFPEILKQLTPIEVRLLDYMVKYATEQAEKLVVNFRGVADIPGTAALIDFGTLSDIINMFERQLPPVAAVISSRENLRIWRTVLEDLERLGVVRQDKVFEIGLASLGPPTITEEFETTNAPILDLIRKAISNSPMHYHLTVVGYQFVSVCRAPLNKSAT